MFVGIIGFPKMKPDREGDFLRWFDWSNSEFMKFDGLVSRRLLKSKTDGTYLAIMELQNEQVFASIHKSEVHKLVHEQLIEMLDSVPKKNFYTLCVSQQGFNFTVT